MSITDTFHLVAAGSEPQTAPAQSLEPLSIQSPGRDWVAGNIAWIIVVGWFIAFHIYWTPAHSGVDQNGYLVGGRMITDHLSTGMIAPDYFAFVGRMWIGTPWQVYYPKYPIGLPVLNAGLLELGRTRWGNAIVYLFNFIKWGLLPVAIFLALRNVLELIKPLKRYRAFLTPASLFVAIGATLIALRVRVGPLSTLPIEGSSAGVVLCHLLSPVAMAFGLIATYQLIRLMAGSFGGLLAMIVVACSPVTLELANNPNSHATTFFCVSWGMFLLIRWWQAGGAWRAAFAGLLLGYAVTIRYTEGMLLLPILVVAIFNLRWKSRQSWIETSLLLAWWAIPVACLVCFNLAAFGAVTGYDSTSESTGFTWRDFQTNWETTVRAMYNTGLFFILPLSFAGLLLMFFRSWKMAVLLCSWIFPSLILYSAYYWAPDNKTIGYMRFYMTILPPLTLTAFWLLMKVIPGAFISSDSSQTSRRATIGSIATAGAFSIISVGILLATQGAQRWQHDNPRIFDTATVQQTRQQAKRAQNGKAPAAAAVDYTARAEERQEEDADDFAQMSAGVKYASWRLAILVAGGGIVLGGIYITANRRSTQRGAIFGAGSIAVGAACAGFLALASGAMNLYSTGSDLEENQTQMLNSAVVADLIVKTVGAPDHSVIFSDDRMLNHLQFIGDYQLYDTRSFSTNYITSLDPKNFDPNLPNPFQEERAAQLFQMVGKYKQTQLLNEEHKLAQDALSRGLHVYAVIPLQQFQLASNSYFPPSLFKIVRRAQWQEPMEVPPRKAPKPHWLGLGANVSKTSAKIAEPVYWVILEIFPAPPKPVVARPHK